MSDYLRIFRRYWWITVVFTLIGAVLGAASWVANLGFIDLTPKYESTATLFVATQTGTTTAEAYQNDTFSQQRAFSYVALATSEQVAARAVDELRAPISAAELQSKITAAPVNKTVLITISVTDSSPARAQDYAAAVSDQLVAVVAELETSRRGGTPSAAAVVVDDANYPTRPVNFKLWLRIALGAGGGFVVGLIVSLLVGVFDRRLRGRDNVEATTDSPVLGALPRDSARAGSAVVDLAGSSLYAERIRELRTNLRFSLPPGSSGAPRTIAVTSPSSGDGRTTTAIDLAAALAESGRAVILVDGDLRNPTLADTLISKDSSRSSASGGLSTVLVGEIGLREAVVTGVDVSGHTIALLPAGPRVSRPGELWATDGAAEVLAQLGQSYDYVIVDTPPLDSFTDGAIVGALGDGAILLARIGSTTGQALRRAVQTLRSAHVTLLGTVVTSEPATRAEVRTHTRQDDRAASEVADTERTPAAVGTGPSTAGRDGEPATGRRSAARRERGGTPESGTPDTGQ